MACNGVASNGVACNGVVCNGVVCNGVASNGVARNSVARNAVASNAVVSNVVVINAVAAYSVLGRGSHSVKLLDQQYHPLRSNRMAGRSPRNELFRLPYIIGWRKMALTAMACVKALQSTARHSIAKGEHDMQCHAMP